MSKKLSQSEIDALVASLLSGEPAEEEKPAQDPPVAAMAAPETPPEQSETPPEVVPAAPAEPAAEVPAPTVVGLTPENMPFELVQDLGAITQAEVDAAVMAYKNPETPATPAVQAEAPAKAPVAQPAAPAAAAAVMAPEAPAPTVALPPSNAAYAASQAQAAQQTRQVLSMAALSSVLMDIELTVTVELGSARLTLGDVLNLGPGSVITLDKQANTPVDVLVNKLPLMKAEVLAIAEKYGVRITKSSLNVKAAS